ncbi:MAG: DUF5063 domain-containing protein [Bacteroidetes bacterium]|nr:DUF5063 domain-containing protein [Bacteroidota bacterium]MBU1577881.1 DUF5063 domain-containing protein [Bacteroidota bacterium]MBU2465347.1 DUF5063 domain-containing protein [Bacteroidota bacterium]MBU2556840.1 DUF5063 domain-containing protein [Bacteroidota bacterium]
MATNDPTLSRNVLEMVAVSSEFCSFLEDASNLKPEVFFSSLQGLVPLLYLRGSLLPDIEPEYPEANARFVTEEQWEGLFNSLRELTGEQDEFWIIDHTGTHITDTLKGSFAEHLTDVYQDMKDFVLLFKKPQLASRENAIASCKENFIPHWGRRLANLLPALHQVKSDANLARNSDKDELI